jgi:hypothetical protein
MVASVTHLWATMFGKTEHSYLQQTLYVWASIPHESVAHAGLLSISQVVGLSSESVYKSPQQLLVAWPHLSFGASGARRRRRD